jgi:hypothetical protein
MVGMGILLRLDAIVVVDWEWESLAVFQIPPFKIDDFSAIYIYF